MSKTTVLAIVLGTLLCLLSVATVTACECCADPAVKVEWRRGWQYDPEVNDGSVVVTGTARLLCWQVISGTAISEIRTKSGWQVECHYPEGEEGMAGCLTAGWHDFSSAWFCKEDKPTAVTLTSLHASECEGVSIPGLLRLAGIWFIAGFLSGGMFWGGRRR